MKFILNILTIIAILGFGIIFMGILDLLAGKPGLQSIIVGSLLMGLCITIYKTFSHIEKETTFLKNRIKHLEDEIDKIKKGA